MSMYELSPTRRFKKSGNTNIGWMPHIICDRMMYSSILKKKNIQRINGIKLKCKPTTHFAWSVLVRRAKRTKQIENEVNEWAERLNQWNILRIFSCCPIFNWNSQIYTPNFQRFQIQKNHTFCSPNISLPSFLLDVCVCVFALRLLFYSNILYHGFAVLYQSSKNAWLFLFSSAAVMLIAFFRVILCIYKDWKMLLEYELFCFVYCSGVLTHIYRCLSIYARNVKNVYCHRKLHAQNKRKTVYRMERSVSMRIVLLAFILFYFARNVTHSLNK